MLRRVEVRDFQSLRSVDLELGRFTVIIGPSNSGKSALLRAIRMVVSNIDAPAGVVRHGAKSTTAALYFEDGTVVVGRGPGRSTYQLNDETYAKAGKTVPEDVEAFLRFAEVEGERLSFAAQFDRPFLLTDPATVVAKVFGDLTNVTVLYAAVREGVRRRLEAGNRLKTRSKDLDDVKERAEEFRDVPAQVEVVKQARRAFDKAQATNGEIERLRKHIHVVKTADAAILDLEQQQTVGPDIDVDALDSKLASLTAFRRTIAAARQAEVDILKAEEFVHEASDRIETLDAKYHELLVEAGTCPMCGQEVQGGVRVGAGNG